jgi:hypothetical protein
MRLVVATGDAKAYDPLTTAGSKLLDEKAVTKNAVMSGLASRSV